MVKLGLSQKWIERMKSLPESGMGYHNVTIKLKNGVILKGIVMNSYILEVVGYGFFKNDDIDEINPA